MILFVIFFKFFFSEKCLVIKVKCDTVEGINGNSPFFFLFLGGLFCGFDKGVLTEKE